MSIWFDIESAAVFRVNNQTEIDAIQPFRNSFWWVLKDLHQTKKCMFVSAQHKRRINESQNFYFIRSFARTFIHSFALHVIQFNKWKKRNATQFKWLICSLIAVSEEDTSIKFHWNVPNKPCLCAVCAHVCIESNSIHLIAQVFGVYAVCAFSIFLHCSHSISRSFPTF